jgi:cupin fold WbuC family metalloprotein
MEKIYSKVKKDLLLHQVLRNSEWNTKEGRINLVENDNFIQCASLNLKAGTTFKPHKHNRVERKGYGVSQESWIVLRGKVKCIFYDLDDTIIAEPILEAGDASFTFFGGHNYLILADNSLILEYKVGPYISQEIDKSFL